MKTHENTVYSASIRQSHYGVPFLEFSAQLCEMDSYSGGSSWRVRARSRSRLTTRHPDFLAGQRLFVGVTLGKFS
jgi:hypothetical protein